MTPNQMNAAIPERRPATEEISGVIERVTFHNDESGFCVLRVKARSIRLSHGANGWWCHNERPQSGIGAAASLRKAKSGTPCLIAFGPPSACNYSPESANAPMIMNSYAVANNREASK
jgi:hypothetical protein